MIAVTTPVYHALDNAFQETAVWYDSGKVEHKYNVYVLEGGSRSSKSHSIIQFFIKWAYSNQGKTNRVIVSRLKGTWITATILNDFIAVLRKYGLYEKRNHNKSTGQGIYTLFTTEFWFLGLDDEQKIHGLESDAFWINEAVEAGKDDFDQLMQRCLGFAVLDYNPSFEEHWIFDTILKRPSTFYHHSTMLDNPMIAANAKRQILGYEPTDENYAAGTVDKRKWLIYGLGKRASLEGLIFENVHIVQAVPKVVNMTKHFGLDFGFSNDVTAIDDVYFPSAGGEIWVDEQMHQSGILANEIGRFLIDTGHAGGGGILPVKGYADSSRPEAIEEIHRMGLNIHPVKKGAESIILGIDIMKRLKINVTERSYNTIKEFRNYTWAQDKNGKWLNVPVDKDNHHMDGIRYVCRMELGQTTKVPVKGARPVSKHGLGFY